MPKYKIEAKHTIYVTYEVEVAEGDDDNDAIDRLMSEGQTLHSYAARS